MLPVSTTVSTTVSVVVMSVVVGDCLFDTLDNHFGFVLATVSVMVSVCDGVVVGL